MIRLGKNSQHDVAAVLKRAENFFGPDGKWGLAVTNRTPDSIRFEGGGGYVTIEVRPEHEGCELEIVAQEWERQAQQFLRKV